MSVLDRNFMGNDLLVDQAKAWMGVWCLGSKWDTEHREEIPAAGWHNVGDRPTYMTTVMIA